MAVLFCQFWNLPSLRRGLVFRGVKDVSPLWESDLCLLRKFRRQGNKIEMSDSSTVLSPSSECGGGGGGGEISAMRNGIADVY